MVRGSSLDSGTNSTSPKTRPKLFSGGITDWKNGDRILVKSYLHTEGLLEVVLRGVAPKAPRTATPSSSSFIGAGTQQPQFNTPTALSGVPGGPGHSTTALPGRRSTWRGPGHPTFKILVQDATIMMSGGRDGTKIIGPFDAATVIDMLESGAIDKDSSLISNYPDDFWEVFTPDKELALHKAVRSQARVAPLILPAKEPEEDTESRTEADNRNAYHVLLQIIDNKCDTGRALLQQADNLFGYTQSGHEFFKWLDDRAKPSLTDDGMINAQDALQDVEDFKLPEGELTKEILILKGDAFKTIYHKQPKERWGIKSDVFKAWAAKLPDEPFKGLLTQIHSLDLISTGPSVLDDFDKANRMLCALYSHWCADHPRVRITPSTHARALVARGGPKGDGWMVCFRCWEVGSHLSFDCPKAPKVCVRCGLDGGKGPSCGGEYEPTKCMVKGFKPSRKVSENYMDKLRVAAEKIGVKFGVPDAEKTASDAEKTALIAGEVTDHSAAAYRFVDGGFQLVSGK